MGVCSAVRWAQVIWHMAGVPETRYEAVSVPLGEDPGDAEARIRVYLAKRYLKTAEAAPLVRLDVVTEYNTEPPSQPPGMRWEGYPPPRP